MENRPGAPRRRRLERYHNGGSYFRALHLPATAALVGLTPLLLLRAFLLNSIGGGAFGWLYWKEGLESAMIAHFFTDAVI